MKRWKYTLVVLFSFMMMSMLFSAKAQAQATKHTVTLKWTQPTDPGITIVDTLVFRSTVKGGPYTAVGRTSSGTALSWVDTTVANGTTYYYVVAALSSTNQQSADSNEATAVLPQETPTPTGLTATVN